MKKIFSFLVALCMAIVSFSTVAVETTVTSETELSDAIADEQYDVIKVSGNFTVSSDITISRSVQLKGINNPVLTGGGSNRFFIINSGTVIIDGITFTGGVKNASGGAIYINGGAPAVTFQNCRFVKNKITTSTTGGGAISIEPSDAVTTNFYNCVFAHNENANANNGFGGAISSSGKPNTLNVINCTFARNVGGRYGGHHISSQNNGTINVKNSIFWGGTNDATTESKYTNNHTMQLRNSNSSIILTNCLTDNGFVASLTTSNNSTNNNWTMATINSIPFENPSSQPGFKATDALTADYSLVSGSLAINASNEDATSTDIRGLDAVGTRDLGAYEYGYSYVNVVAASGITLGQTYPLYVPNGNHTLTFTSESPMTASVYDGASTQVVIPTVISSGSYEIALTGLDNANIEVTLAPAVGVTYTGLTDLTWIDQLPQVPQGATIMAKFEITSGYVPRVEVISDGNITYPLPTPVTGQAGVDTYSFTYSAGTTAIEFRAIDATNPANPVTLYVNGTSGSDSNTGYSADAPLKTLKTATGITEAVASGSYINITGNTNVTAGVTISKALTLSGPATLNIQVGEDKTAITITSTEEVIIKELTFEGDGSTSGKAIVSGAKDTNYTIRNCKFTGLNTTLNGGVVFANAANNVANSSTANIINCLFTNNSSNSVEAGWGSGAVSANNGATINIYNSTFYGNTSNKTTAGQAIAANWDSATINLYNSIVVGNGSKNDLGGQNSSGVINLYSTIYGTAGYGVTADGNSTDNITDITDICISTSDFTPKAGSIAIGKSVDGTDTDITGKTKVETRDIGAYESNFVDPLGTSLSELDAETGPTRYFNLQGIEVHTPVKGNVYIVKQGEKTRKILYL